MVKNKRVARVVIENYMKRRKTEPTTLEVVKGTRLNAKTVRNNLGNEDLFWGNFLVKRVCSVSGKLATTYRVSG